MFLDSVVSEPHISAIAEEIIIFIVTSASHDLLAFPAYFSRQKDVFMTRITDTSNKRKFCLKSINKHDNINRKHKQTKKTTQCKVKVKVEMWTLSWLQIIVKHTFII